MAGPLTSAASSNAASNQALTIESAIRGESCMNLNLKKILAISLLAIGVLGALAGILSAIPTLLAFTATIIVAASTVVGGVALAITGLVMLMHASSLEAAACAARIQAKFGEEAHRQLEAKLTAMLQNQMPLPVPTAGPAALARASAPALSLNATSPTSRNSGKAPGRDGGGGNLIVTNPNP